MRRAGELPELEEALLGIEHVTPEEEAAREKSQQQDVEVRKAYLTMLMSDPMFRAWLMGVLEGWNTFGMTFGHGPTGYPDPRGTDFALGMKAAGQHLWELFDDLCPDLTSKMRRESRERAAKVQ